jgi:flagellar hook protein FlgE
VLRSLFSAISGLQAHQTKMDVVGNNIANVNTVGYKSQTTVFEDTLSQILRNGSAPTATTAGTNPAQVGLGVKVGDITTNFSQGSTQSTGRSTDFLISGDGFFVTAAGNEKLYTRAGSFDLDATGRLITPDGAILQGWMSDPATGQVNTNGPIQNLSIPFGSIMAPAMTTAGALNGNLPAASTGTTPPGSALVVQATMYNALGAAHPITYTFTPTSTAGTWNVDVQDENGVSLAPSPATIVFDTATGKLTTPAGGTLTFDPTQDAALGSWTNPVSVDLNQLSQFGGKATLAVTDGVAGAGNAMGTLSSFSLGDDGSITGVYSNGLTKPIGQLALASFANPAGLTKAGNSSYRVGDNSGSPNVGVAGTGGRGSLSAGALEMSNVDLSQEFTGLIIAQRGFQANSKVITTSDQILNDLVNMKQ